MIEPSHVAGLVSLTIVGLAAYSSWVGLGGNQLGRLKEWVDQDFPEIRHTPKTTWLTGFRYNRHGIPQVAKLEVPVFLDYDIESRLGRFSAVDTFARSTNVLDGEQTTHDKDLVQYDFGLDLELQPGGRVAVTEIFKRISITEIEPIIEDSACERRSDKE